MNKIAIAQKILKNRLPTGYSVDVKTYATTGNIFRTMAKKYFNGNYKKCVTWYRNRIQNPKINTYIKTKYYNNTIKKEKNTSPYGIVAIASTPISLSLERINNLPLSDICFILLHEIGHNVLNTLDERKCDMFAIRWTKKLIKEGLIKWKK